MPVPRFHRRAVIARPLPENPSLAPAGERPHLATDAGTLMEQDRSSGLSPVPVDYAEAASPARNCDAKQAKTRPTWKRGAYLVARGLTQVGILATAAMSASPVLTPVVVHLGPPTGIYRLPISAVSMLLCITVGSFALTNLLRDRWQTAAALPQSAG